MSQEMFPGKVSRRSRRRASSACSACSTWRGRFFWASTSDYIGRKNTYFCFFVLGYMLVLHGAVDRLDRQRGRCSCCAFVVIMSMYGGGFATVPAYLRDMFGTRYVGAIHGLAAHRLVDGRHLRAGAGELHSPVQIDHGVPKAQAYNVTMYIMAGAAGDRLHLQLDGQGGAIKRFHMKPGSRGAARSERRRPANGQSLREEIMAEQTTQAHRRSSSSWPGALSASPWLGACCQTLRKRNEAVPIDEQHSSS